MLVVLGVEVDERGDGSDFWFGGLGLGCESAGERKDCEGEALHSVAPMENWMPKYSAREDF